MSEQLDRTSYNERFLQRLLRRRPQDLDHYEAALQPTAEAAGLEAVETESAFSRDAALETIVSRERPVLFVRQDQFDAQEVTAYGNEAGELIQQLVTAGPQLTSLLPLIGRIDVANFPGVDYVGTGWLVAPGILVTNRHVASLVAKWDGRQYVFNSGMGGRRLDVTFSNRHEVDSPDAESEIGLKIEEVLYIEPDLGPNDIAFVRVEQTAGGSTPAFIPLAPDNVAEDDVVCVIGYPAKASRRVIPNQDLMQELYLGKYDVKRAAPGLGLGTTGGASEHDCTTLGGNSGSVLLNLQGRAVGLHFAGLYQQANYAVPASILNDYVTRKRWNQPIRIEDHPPESRSVVVVSQGNPSPQQSGSVTFTVPLVINVSLGTLSNGGAAIQALPGSHIQSKDAAEVEAAAEEFWRNRPAGIVAVRVGYLDDGDEIGTIPCIAASVSPADWSRLSSSVDAQFQDIPIRFFPADVDEQIDAMPALEAPGTISYDDDARASDDFSFSAVNEQMSVRVHVGPEYSWDVLKAFLRQAEGHIVSAMYEFHGNHVRDEIDARLERGASMTLVLDNSTFSRVRNHTDEFDREEVFEKWAERHDFERIVAPEGRRGLISNAYHIKVTVRDDDTFWLSSGNWKKNSSQPVISDRQRDNSENVDLPGNREWHVVIRNATLANRLRHHILQDFQRSTELGGGPLPRGRDTESYVYVPILEEGIELERSPPSRLVKPKDIEGRVKVRLLLTPDQEGEVYSEAVLDLIRSARRSLLFQIPYISMPSHPRSNRGYIDELIQALISKLRTLDDARIILRSGGSGTSSPTHAAWYLQSKGVDIRNRLRSIGNHHTKGMIVDGRKVLLGSHNWSQSGVTLNRDASLIFDNRDISDYYSEAFEIDWERANRVRSRRYRRPESVIAETVDDEVPAGFRRILLSDWLRDD